MSLLHESCIETAVGRQILASESSVFLIIPCEALQKLSGEPLPFFLLINYSFAACTLDEVLDNS
jgi:hypothetical protein